MEIFIDSSAFISGFIKTDSNHKRATECYKKFSDSVKFSTTDLVYFECMTVISQKAGLIAAKSFSAYFKSLHIKTYTIKSKEILLAEQLMFSARSKNIAFFDCLYVAIMEINKIDKIFTYDGHFKKLGVAMIG